MDVYFPQYPSALCFGYFARLAFALATSDFRDVSSLGNFHGYPKRAIEEVPYISASMLLGGGPLNTCKLRYDLDVFSGARMMIQFLRIRNQTDPLAIIMRYS